MCFLQDCPECHVDKTDCLRLKTASFVHIEKPRLKVVRLDGGKCATLEIRQDLVFDERGTVPQLHAALLEVQPDETADK